MTVRGLIQIAYERYAGGRFHPLDFRDFPPIEGGPNWLDSDRFDISAKADGRFSQAMMNGPMLQALLEDRFKLKLHRESRVVSVYALTVAKVGPKLHPLKKVGCASLDPENPPPAPGAKLPVLCGTNNAADDLSGPSIFTAMQEPLGLKLVPAKGSIEVLMVDHVERPSEN